jgi:hypothetical protein
METYGLGIFQWAIFIRLTTSGRILGVCRANPAHLFWISEKELDWQACPHCLGWWCLDE